MKDELHPTQEPLVNRTFLDMDDSVKLTYFVFVFWCGHFQRQRWVYYVTVPRGIRLRTACEEECYTLCVFSCVWMTSVQLIEGRG